MIENQERCKSVFCLHLWKFMEIILERKEGFLMMKKKSGCFLRGLAAAVAFAPFLHRMQFRRNGFCIPQPLSHCFHCEQPFALAFRLTGERFFPRRLHSRAYP